MKTHFYDDFFKAVTAVLAERKVKNLRPAADPAVLGREIDWLVRAKTQNVT